MFVSLSVSLKTNLPSLSSTETNGKVTDHKAGKIVLFNVIIMLFNDIKARKKHLNKGA